MHDGMKDDLRAALAARSIPFDGRWGEERLREELEKVNGMSKQIPEGMVEVRITKFATTENKETGKRPARISNGNGGFAEPGDILVVDRKVGKALEARGFGEIQNDIQSDED